MEQEHNLKWKVKHPGNFGTEIDFLETILEANGVTEDKVYGILHPSSKNILSPFSMRNMREGVEILHKYLEKKSRIFVKVDPDVDGFCSSSILIDFIKKINPQTEIEYKLNYDKEHGLTYKDISNYTADYFDLIIIPDASMTCEAARTITKNFKSKILVLDHHLIEEEYYNKITGQWISKNEYQDLLNTNPDQVEKDVYTNYCTAINCTDGEYKNPNLCGAGVVQKFLEAYIDTYFEESDGETLLTYYYDLVSLALVGDSMDLRAPESRYYVYKGLEEEYYHNDLLKEIAARKADDLPDGRYIGSLGWIFAPLINGCVRFGKEEEQLALFRAMLGEKETIVYQPRRKSKDDPIPSPEEHTLQWDVARNLNNIKKRQDEEVLKYCKTLEEKIKNEHLDENSILFVDGTLILASSATTGLVCNKLSNKYFRPVVLLRAKDSSVYGGSFRGFEKGSIESAREVLEKCGVTCMGHSNAGGVNIKKAELEGVIEKCNKLIPLKDLCVIHQVDWEIEAKNLKPDYIRQVADNYQVWCSTIPEPTFAITNLQINASAIRAIGERGTFIRFDYQGISFIKKYCKHDDFDKMTLKTRETMGVNKKQLSINIIGQFVLNHYDNKVEPQVKILEFESFEIPKESVDPEWEFEAEAVKPAKKVVEEEDFDW